jgi:hypothetical protein
MRRLVIAVPVLAVLASAGSISTAFAQDYPYCLVGENYGWPGLCYFSAYQQCQAAAYGTGSYCAINPRFAFYIQQPGLWPAPH